MSCNKFYLGIQDMNILFTDCVAQQENCLQESMMNLLGDEGYSGSQEIAVSLENDEEETIIKDYFSEQPNLHDLSFPILCAQACPYSDESNNLLFENL